MSRSRISIVAASRSSWPAVFVCDFSTDCHPASCVDEDQVLTNRPASRLLPQHRGCRQPLALPPGLSLIDCRTHEPKHLTPGGLAATAGPL